MPLTPRDNYTNFRQNKLINKGLSDYSISSVPNKPLVSTNLQNINPNYNFNNMISIILQIKVQLLTIIIAH